MKLKDISVQVNEGNEYKSINQSFYEPGNLNEPFQI